MINIIVQNRKLNAGTERAAEKLYRLLSEEGINSKISSVVNDKEESNSLYRWFKNLYSIAKLVKNSHSSTSAYIGTGHFINISLCFMKVFFNIKVVACEHLPYTVKTRLQKISVKLCYPLNDAIVLLTDRDMSSYESFKYSCVIPNYIETTFSKNKKSIFNNNYLIVGRISHQKGSDLIPSIATELNRQDPTGTLIIAGGGERLSDIKKEITTNNVVFVGEVENKKVIELLYESKVMLLPSRYEGFPFVILESFSSGTPVVAFDCYTGPREMITNPLSGRVVEMYDVKSMISEAIKLATIENRETIATHCLKEVEEYSKKNVAKKWTNTLEQIGVL